MSPPCESRLFAPLQIGTITAQHRIIHAPLTRLRATKDHVPLTPMVKEYYTQRCSTPGTFLIAESNIIAPEHGGAPHMPGIWNSDQVAAWKEIVDAVHEKDCFIYCQLIALGRVAKREALDEEVGKGVWGGKVCSSGEIPFTEGQGSIPHALTEEEISEMVRSFAQAAKNAVQEAGFDGVEIHGANGYLVDQFTQDCVNTRQDSYGGSVENRARFALEIADAVSDEIGAEKLGFRLSPWSTFQGMKMHSEEAILDQFTFLTQKLAERGLSYLHVVESRVINNVDTEKKEGIEPFLRIWTKHTPRPEASPILVAGGFSPESAKYAMDVEYKDFETAVVFGRHFIANPDLVFRVRHEVELNKYDRETFYVPEEEKGYIDYPFCGEYMRQGGR